MMKNWLRMKLRRWLGDHEFEDVRACHNKFGILVNNTPNLLTLRLMKERIDFLAEELNELGDGNDNQLIAEVADALIDLAYVAKGTAVMMGLPWQELWDDVQRANMAKQAGIGKRGHKVDLIKPAGWQGPRTMEILSRHGLDFDRLRNGYDYPSEKQ